MPETDKEKIERFKALAAKLHGVSARVSTAINLVGTMSNDKNGVAYKSSAILFIDEAQAILAEAKKMIGE